ncbi:MAG TPA: class I SAM-dependent methyltransferase [Actinomycetota bacterium]|nr:class I SAM-dependent methyltransferase [Actinomycetota bacterium]
MAEIHDRIREWWDADAAVYDHSPSHAASDPLEAAAWRAALSAALPARGARVLDVGAGTGSMTMLAAELGYEVTALDLSPLMLERAQHKAAERAVRATFVVGPAEEPPPGPFDAVMERHMLWTLPDPDRALRAWRGSVAPGGRLVLFEGIWGKDDLPERVKRRAAEVLVRLYGIPHDHHAEYDPEILSQLPLGRSPSAEPLIHAVYRAGWRGSRIRRLRDVEWARRIASRPLLGWLEQVPQYVLVADA